MRALPRPVPAVLGALALLVAACGPASSTSAVAQGLESGPDGWHGVEVDRDELPEVTLTDTDGAPVSLPDAVLGTPTLLFFGYTSCPDICPVHLSTLASAMDSAGVGYDEVDVVFVSVDPERDTAERIDDFLANFDRRMIGLRGERATLEDALDQLELGGPTVEGADPRGEGELIGHPAQVIGFDAEGTMRRVWPFGARRSDWVDDLPRIVEEWST